MLIHAFTSRQWVTRCSSCGETTRQIRVQLLLFGARMQMTCLRNDWTSSPTFFFFFRKPTLTHTLPLKSLVLDSGLRRSQDLISVPSQITYTLLGLDKSNASGNPLLIDILDNDVKLNETCASKHINSFFWFCSVTSLKSGIKSRNYTRAFWLNGYFFALSGCSV